ncbi:hypothetical protein BDN71DRAFT_1591053 [Pleurotus eryngii]|uniref:Fungal lipase-type domain-containing protein n=1 Tax=Pleurotus eryngii TaxID=5323 RepID=A0A9P5ZWC8_PLEER|nr:hypothetical protein BDN71DRAFT_1591053 [Pleurotus eryngii]
MASVSHATTGPNRVWYIADNPSATFGDATYDTHVLDVAGTAEGSLENMSIRSLPMEQQPAAKQTIVEFLAIVPPTSRLMFTGHSLGGALSPTVALALLKAGLLKDASGNIFTYPTAGPSPGNRPFEALSASTVLSPLRSSGASSTVLLTGPKSRADLSPASFEGGIRELGYGW